MRAWIYRHPKHAVNVMLGLLLVAAALWLDAGRSSIFMAATGGLLLGMGSIAWMLDEACETAHELSVLLGQAMSYLRQRGAAPWN